MITCKIRFTNGRQKWFQMSKPILKSSLHIRLSYWGRSTRWMIGQGTVKSLAAKSNLLLVKIKKVRLGKMLLGKYLTITSLKPLTLIFPGGLNSGKSPWGKCSYLLIQLMKGFLKELSICHKRKFSKTYIFVTWLCKPMIFDQTEFTGWNINIKYMDIGIEKSERVSTPLSQKFRFWKFWKFWKFLKAIWKFTKKSEGLRFVFSLMMYKGKYYGMG